MMTAVLFYQVRDGRNRWKAEAACRDADPNIFYPVHNTQEDLTKAKVYCDVCPVNDECLQAGAGEDFGIWGGVLSRKSRKTALRKRGALQQVR